MIINFSPWLKSKNEPTHITKNYSTYTNILFTLQTNLAIESGVHFPPHTYRYDQIIFVNFDLRIFHSPLYERNVWVYKQANIELITQALDNI